MLPQQRAPECRPVGSVQRCSLLPPPPVPPSRPQELGQTAYGNPHSVTPSSVRASREVEGVRRRLMALFGADPKEYEVRAVQSVLSLASLLSVCRVCCICVYVTYRTTQVSRL